MLSKLYIFSVVNITFTTVQSIKLIIIVLCSEILLLIMVQVFGAAISTSNLDPLFYVDEFGLTPKILYRQFGETFRRKIGGTNSVFVNYKEIKPNV